MDEGKVSVKFPFTSDELERMNLGLLEQLSPRDLEIVKDLVTQCEGRLGYRFRSGLVFALVDHLRNSEIRRYADDEHPFRWIVKKVHPREYDCAKWMIDRLADGEMRLEVPRSEARVRDRCD